AAVHNHYGIELDVQLTRDQIPVVFHDGNLLRACGVKHKVSELTYQELSTYRLFQSQERIPTLEEALNAIGGKVPLIIELKIPWHAKLLCRKVSEILQGYKGVYCIESFNPFGLMWYRKNHPEVVRGQLSTDFRKEKIEGSKVQYFILKHLLMNFLTKPDFIAYDHQYISGLSITLCRKLYRIKTVAWTIRSQEELDRNRKFFDWFIFENFKPKNAS
ncbi:MAG: glycerophosphodiester phosphodiesterase, partial [Clostridiales bacterium]|nr:glycerophosphodiester phosphodiesterase [Clostridiales bacterium]